MRTLLANGDVFFVVGFGFRTGNVTHKFFDPQYKFLID
jgi:hypothetical protein